MCRSAGLNPTSSMFMSTLVRERERRIVPQLLTQSTDPSSGEFRGLKRNVQSIDMHTTDIISEYNAQTTLAIEHSYNCSIKLDTNYIPSHESITNLNHLNHLNHASNLTKIHPTKRLYNSFEENDIRHYYVPKHYDLFDKFETKLSTFDASRNRMISHRKLNWNIPTFSTFRKFKQIKAECMSTMSIHHAITKAFDPSGVINRKPNYNLIEEKLVDLIKTSKTSSAELKGSSREFTQLHNDTSNNSDLLASITKGLKDHKRPLKKIEYVVMDLFTQNLWKKLMFFNIITLCVVGFDTELIPYDILRRLKNNYFEAFGSIHDYLLSKPVHCNSSFDEFRSVHKDFTSGVQEYVQFAIESYHEEVQKTLSNFKEGTSKMASRKVKVNLKAAKTTIGSKDIKSFLKKVLPNMAEIALNILIQCSGRENEKTLLQKYTLIYDQLVVEHDDAENKLCLDSMLHAIVVFIPELSNDSKTELRNILHEHKAAFKIQKRVPNLRDISSCDDVEPPDMHIKYELHKLSFGHYNIHTNDDLFSLEE